MYEKVVEGFNIKYLFLTIFLLPSMLFAQLRITSQGPQGDDSFAITKSKSVASIVYDSNDFKVVHKSAGFLASDIEMIPQIRSY
ncbi:MAG: hypothetical protein K9G70_11445 [Prolixibacteraceae bacterium]|nr:hypothetical protein [Prolixibacteraceae bacterium]